MSFSEIEDESSESSESLGRVAYLAFDENGNESLFSSQFNISSEEEPFISHRLVAKVGELASEVNSELTGNIQDLSVYDPINGSGQIAFWVETTTSEEAIVRANPVRKPVLIVPGIGGSLPKNATLGNPFQFGNYADWIRNRGVDPETLAPEFARKTYDDLIETLKRSGYQEGVDLFVATYDWRLNPGPIDGSIDGTIERSVEELTDDTYEYAVDHLGYWLEKAVKGRKSQFEGLPEAEIPELDSVDIVAHSTGGLVTKSYIQSNAYGESFTDDNGKEITLPKVNNFFMVAVPNRGSSLSWNALQNNFIVEPGGRASGAMIRSAFNKIYRWQNDYRKR